MNAFNLLVITVAAIAFTAIQYADADAYVLSILSLTAVVMLIKRNNINVVHICSIVLITALLEYCIILLTSHQKDIPTIYWGSFIFGIQILICYVAIKILILRTYLSRKLLTFTNSEKFNEVHMTHAEGILAGLYRIITLVLWLALIENLLRHLEQLGISKNITNIFQDLTLVYDNYEIFIYPLRAIICGVVLSLLVVSKIDTERLERQQAV
ncbi:hypothetical protein J8M21_13305 [Pseudoalteromonas luteoviolacea]|uniref:hypothetical protein n=1 Tax=Pseudoalteromonas TaxID=53246 RepID=UPI001B39D2BC|nr:MULTISPECIES: hypothetical protein [Pseudoalteromonas]MBQ4878185.1 hypothetical protein [Pseudoalteromonas luteoviolacea]MBQ4907340.1 hypothetical protein [Pseudoalteromonas luteoviolacea]MDK1289008.1 hypothetical protein [Pseudoalteromonas sp. B95]